MAGGVRWWPVVRRWEPRGGKRLKCSALIFENKHSHSPALEHAAGTSTQIIWDIWIFEIFQTKNSAKWEVDFDIWDQRLSSTAFKHCAKRTMLNWGMFYSAFVFYCWDFSCSYWPVLGSHNMMLTFFSLFTSFLLVSCVRSSVNRPPPVCFVFVENFSLTGNDDSSQNNQQLIFVLFPHF